MNIKYRLWLNIIMTSLILTACTRNSPVYVEGWEFTSGLEGDSTVHDWKSSIEGVKLATAAKWLKESTWGGELSKNEVEDLYYASLLLTDFVDFEIEDNKPSNEALVYDLAYTYLTDTSILWK